MYRVIDTFRTTGLFVVLDPDQVHAPFPPVKAVRVRKPDGTFLTLVVDRVEVGAGGVVALVLPSDPNVEIPRGSIVETTET